MCFLLTSSGQRGSIHSFGSLIKYISHAINPLAGMHRSNYCVFFFVVARKFYSVSIKMTHFGEAKATNNSGHEFDLNIDPKINELAGTLASEIHSFSPLKHFITIPFPTKTPPAQSIGIPASQGASRPRLLGSCSWLGNDPGNSVWIFPGRFLTSLFKMNCKSYARSYGNGRKLLALMFFVWQSYFKVTFGRSVCPSF